MLASEHRVKTGSDYRHIVRQGTRIRCAGLILHFLETQPSQPARFGFIITKALGKSHDRNALRRKLKAVSARLLEYGLSGVDVIVRPQPGVFTMSFSELFASIVNSMNERGLLQEVRHV